MIILIAKSDQLDQPKEFRPIALLNTSGKIFFSLLNSRLERYMLTNGYINLSVQKAFLSGMPGCVEHTAKLDEALRIAKSTRRPICVSFIDLENAYGSVKHNMIQFALDWYHVPKPISLIFYNYYEGQMARISTTDWTTDWFRILIGVFQGCTGSTGLFDVAFNILLDALHAPEYQQLGFRVVPTPEANPMTVAAYADDVTLVSELPEQNQRLIDRFQEMLTWSRTMHLKPVKCRTLALRPFVHPSRCIGKYTAAQPVLQYSSYDPLLTANGTPICFIGVDGAPFKFLGMLVAGDLSDDHASSLLVSRLNDLLEFVQKQRLSDWMKLWLYNFYVATKLQWMLTIYSLPLTLLEQIEATCTRYLKKWLGLPPSAAVDILYLARAKLGLQAHNMVVLYKRMQITRLHLLKSSRDPEVRRLYERLRDKERDHRLKWSATAELEHHSAFLINQQQLNEQVRSRGCLGYKRRSTVEPRPASTSTARERKAISELVATAADDERLAHLRTLQMQGQWSRWDAVASQDLSWRRMFAASISDEVLKFVVNAQLLTLPSEDNKRRWGYASATSMCRIELPDGNSTCSTPHPTALHVLTGCKAALEQGRYTWRHNSVLLVLKQQLVPWIDKINRNAVQLTAPTTALRFRREDGTWYQSGNELRARAPVSLLDYLSRARDWEVFFDDLPGNDRHSYSSFPPDIVSTSLRPDVLIISRQHRYALCLELTCPAEERITTAHSLKRDKYADLTASAKEQHWDLSTWPFEVGCRGFVALSTITMLKQFGFPRPQQLQIKQQLEDVARRCSYYIFCCRRQAQWDSKRPLLPSSGPFKFTEDSDA